MTIQFAFTGSISHFDKPIYLASLIRKSI